MAVCTTVWHETQRLHTEMACDDVDLVNGLAEHGSCLLHEVVIANAMKPVASDAVTLCKLRGDGVRVGGGGHG